MLLSRRQMMSLLVVLGGAGCQRTPRSGIPRTEILLRISSDGRPLTMGVVDLYNSETGEGGSGTLNGEGEVRMTQVALGDYVVTIIPPGPEGPEGKLPASMKEYRVASRFRTPEKSPLKISVDRKTTEFNLEVSEK